MSATTTPADVRSKLAVALDVDDLVEATRMAKELAPYFGVAKVGLELFSAAGTDAVVTMAELGYKVFLDVKLHDVPTTVRKAARVLGAVGASYLTLHAFGGVSMMRGGVEGLRDGAAAAGLDPPTALAVTILTPGPPPHILGVRVRDALEAGCGGVVCTPADVREAKQLAPRMVAVVPGVRLTGGDSADSSTPQAALDAGADLLVVGRAVTAADDRAAAAARLVASVS